MADLRFIDDARIIIKAAPGAYVNINPDQLSAELVEMIKKQIYVNQDLILKVHVQASSMDPENSVTVSTVCWDGASVQRVFGRHKTDGTYEKIDDEFM